MATKKIKNLKDYKGYLQKLLVASYSHLSSLTMSSEDALIKQAVILGQTPEEAPKDIQLVMKLRSAVDLTLEKIAINNK